MSASYENEQATLKAEAAALQQEIEAQSTQAENLERFIQINELLKAGQAA